MAQVVRHGRRILINVKKRWYCSGRKDDSTTITGGDNNNNKVPNSSQDLRSVPPTSLSSTLSPTTASTTREKDQQISFRTGSEDTHFDFSTSFKRSESWRTKLVSSMLVYVDFISKEEETSILKEIEPYLSRLHYEESHWDDAIHAYRETERSKWTSRNEVIINRIRQLAFPPQVPQLKLVHILDLAKNGVIKPHIDSVRFCGNTIGGLSLLSDCVMRLRHDVQKDFHCDIYLPRLSLYVMKDFSRYEFTHEILGESESAFKTSTVARDRRISIICRNEPSTTTSSVSEPIFTSLAGS